MRAYHFPDCAGRGCNCRERVQRDIAGLELPPCDCPLALSCPCGENCPPELRWRCRCCREECCCPPSLWQPPCRHGLEFEKRFPLKFRTWARLLWQLDPAAHAEPKATPAAALVLRRQAVVAIYAEREARGLRLWCAGDLHRRQPMDDGIQAGPVAENEKNGARAVLPKLGNRRADQ